MGTDLMNSSPGSIKSVYESPQLTLREALEAMEGGPPSSIPWIVKLLENPTSPMALPGKIDLFGHDCLHLLLGKGLSLNDEAFVVGFTMGNDTKTKRLHLAIFKFCSSVLYPKNYRFNQEHLHTFDLGVAYGRSVRFKNLNQVGFSCYQDHTIRDLREMFGIS